MILTFVIGVCLLHLGPHAIAHGGMNSLVGFVAGIGLPALLLRAGRQSLWVVTALGTLGLHGFVEGAVLGSLTEASELGVGVAIVAHRIPIGLAVSLRAPRSRAALTVLTGMAVLNTSRFAPHLPSHGDGSERSALAVARARKPP